jgi:hypothetical protein
MDSRLQVHRVTLSTAVVCPVSAKSVNSFSEFRLFDVAFITSQRDSWDLKNFRHLIFQQILANQHILRTDWYCVIQEIFLVVITLKR